MGDSDSTVFVNRRQRRNRRVDPDPCEKLPVDLYHRKRRKSTERRDTKRTLEDDYHAYMGENGGPETTPDSTPPSNKKH